MKICQKLNKISQNLPDYSLLALSLLIIYSAIIYYFYTLNWGSVIIIILITGLSFFFLFRRLFKVLIIKTVTEAVEGTILNITEKKSGRSYFKYWPFLIYFLLYAFSFYLLFLGQSDRALISPWQTVNPYFFFTYFFSSLSLAFILFNKKISTTSKLIGLSVHYFLSFSVAAMVYKIGYGFDPFIHQATMELIDKKGLVMPKPFYYLGEYGLIIVFHKLSGLSIYILNKFLVPFLAALFLPLSLYRLTRASSQNYSRWLTPLILLALTFSPLIVTTPQNLSYLFLALTIIFGLTKNDLLWPLILALATLAIHPLTGLPALCWWLVLLLNRYSKKVKKHTYHLLKYLLFLASIFVLPLALFIGGGGKLEKFNWNFYFLIEPLKNLFSTLSVAGQENWLLNFVYFIFYNYSLWLVLIIIVSLVFFYRQSERQNFKSLIFINLALLFSYLISSQIIFTDLINYEQTNFASRLLVLITIFFLPFIVLACQNFIDLVLTKNKLTKIIWLSFGLALITISLYISYPRIDRYFNARGYSTSQNDILAVKLIDSEADSSYAVLANQQVSVAALKELGFDHYYETAAGPIYFYPIPTGGRLYGYYLDMVYKNPSRETMAQARALTGAKESYLVINKYWFQSARIINAAKLTADSWQTINNEVYIFKYLP